MGILGQALLGNYIIRRFYGFCSYPLRYCTFYDDQLSEAYTIRGNYYKEIGKTEQAIKEFDKAVKFNPNDWMAYRKRGIVYTEL